MQEPQHYWPADKPRLPEQDEPPKNPANGARVIMPITLDYAMESDYRRATGGEDIAPKALRNLDPTELEAATRKSLDE